MIKGLLIEDDIDTIMSYQDRFKLYDLNLISVENFPNNPKDFFDIALDQNVDFIIIDNHLDKKHVDYNGIDVLDEIRRQDKEIFILYLTNKDFVKEKLNMFDMEINKMDLPQRYGDVSERIKRAISRDVMIKLEREIEQSAEIQKQYYENKIAKIKELIGEVDG